MRSIEKPSPPRASFAAVAAILALSMVAPAVADPRPTIRVTVALAEPSYRTYYGEETTDLEADLAKLFASGLEQRVGFLRFVAGALAGEAADAELRLVVGDPTPGSLRPVQLSAELSGPAVAGAPPPKRWLVRSEEQSLLPPGKADVFASDIARVALPDDCCPTWIAGLLSEVELGREAAVFFDDRDWLWALPFRLDDVRAGRDTEFLIDAEIPLRDSLRLRRYRTAAEGHTGDDELRVPSAFRGQAMTRITDPAAAAELAEVEADESVRVERVRLVAYVASLAPPPPPPSPSSIDVEVP